MKKTILYVGVSGTEFTIKAEHVERAETLIKSGQAIELPESIWEAINPAKMQIEAKRIRFEQFGF